MSYGQQQYGGSQYGFSAAQLFERLYAESVQLDEVRVLDISVVRNESASFNDLYSSVYDGVRVYNESASFNEFLDDEYALFRDYSESAVFNDFYTREALLNRSYAEQAGFGLVYARNSSYFRVLPENVFFNEVYGRRIDAFRYYDDNIAVDDTFINLTRLHLRTYSESVNFSEFYGPVSISLVRQEQVSLTEVYSKTGVFDREFVEMQEFADTSLLALRLWFGEEISLSDQYESAAGLYRFYGELTGFGIEGLTEASFIRYYVDGLELRSEEILKYTGFRGYEESLSLERQSSFGVSKVLVESLELFEKSDVLRTRFHVYFESLAVKDEFGYSILRSVLEAELESDIYEECSLSADVFEENSIAADVFERIDIDSKIE